MGGSGVLNFIVILLLSPLTICFKSSEISKLSQKNVSNQISDPDRDSSYVLVATVDGTVSLLETSSMKVDWTFRTGKSIYTSYKAPHYLYTPEENDTELGDDFYMDCNNDWQLYNCSMHNRKCINEIVDAQEYIGSLPYSLTDRIVLGKIETSAFLLDSKTGSLLKTYRYDDMIYSPKAASTEGKGIILSKEHPAMLESGFDEHRELIYIERKDYKLQCISIYGAILWSVSFSELEAKLQHHKGMQFFGGSSSTSKTNNRFQLSHKRRSPVIRLRNYNYEKLISKLGAVDGDLFLPSPDINPQLAPAKGVPLALPGYRDDEVLSLPLPDTAIPEIANILDEEVEQMESAETFYDSAVRIPLHFLIMALVALCSICGLFFRRFKLGKHVKVPYEAKVPGMAPKKKKPKNKGNIKTSTKELGNVLRGKKDFSTETFPDLVGNQLEGLRVGKLNVSNQEIAKGSNGTVVLEGSYEGRLVAVKRLVQTHHDVAQKEILNLMASDIHPNIVRWYGVDQDEHFIYISLERCACNLNDLIFGSYGSLGNQMDSDYNHAFQIKLILENGKGMNLWKENGHPSPLLLKLMRDIVSGLAHLHEIGIIHRDLKPQNVLISKNQSLCAKLSDMGISKRLPADTSALTRNATSSGSSGWQAPEQLRNERQTRAVDLFSLGCVLFFCMTAGKHPYGVNFERDINVLNDRKDLFLVENLPEAVDLISSLLSPSPNLRPRAQDVLNHPLFWNSDTRLSFLRDASDRVELENREEGSQLLAALESTATATLNGRWDEKMDSLFIDNIGRYRRYRFDSIRDLLRVIRNKLNHYRELPEEIQQLLGSVPEGFDHYFSSRFPKLLMEVYKVLYRFCKNEEFFHKYSKCSVI